MFLHLENSLNQYNDIDLSPLLDDIFDSHAFLGIAKSSEGILAIPDRAFSPLDASSNSSSSQSMSTPEAADNSNSISETLISQSEKDIDTSITSARRRSWRSFRRTLPANLKIAPDDSLDALPEQPLNLFMRRSSATKRSVIVPQPTSRRPSTPSIFSDSGLDMDGESDGAGSDDDYIPPPGLDVKTTRTLKRRRSGSSTQHNKTSTRSLPSNSVSSSHCTAKRVRMAPPSRNKQASQASLLVITRVVDNSLIEQTNFICPECGWKQVNKRVPDFKRHLKTHLRPKDDDHSLGYWCKGVRIEDARQYAIHPDSTPYRFLDHERIGGCMRTFSRNDALKRHLHNANITCVREMLD